MKEITEDCRQRLREIDRRLEILGEALDSQSSVTWLMWRVRIAWVANTAAGALSVDADCQRILRELEPRISSISRAIKQGLPPAEIRVLIEQTRRLIGIGGAFA